MRPFRSLGSASQLATISFDCTAARCALAVLCAALASACGGGGPNLEPRSMPAGGNFTGVYYSPQYGEMNMIQNGSAVVGDYKQDERSGKIQGEATGDLMKFEWTEEKSMVSNRPTETRGHGYFRYEIDPANGDHVLKGEWGLGDAASGGGPWNAVKSKRKVPHLAEATSGDESNSGSSSDSNSDSNSNDNDKKGDSDDLF